MSEMNGNESDPAAPVKIEDVMQEVRRTIMQRQLPGQIQLPEATRNLPPEYYEHLARAGLAQTRLEVDLLVTPSRAPLIGPLIDRLRRKVHELVLFYINRFAANQARVNNHMLQALTVLGDLTVESDMADPGAARRAGNAVAAESEWATVDDVHACYHLLLERRPDEGGLHYWTNMVTNNRVVRGYVIDSFLNGAEFRELQAARNNPVLIDLPRFRMYVRLNDNFIGMHIAHERQYEPHVTRVLSDLLSTGDTFVDVGANIGFFALLGASLVGPAGQVIAFEPNPANCDLLRRSAEANEFAGRIAIHPVAVAERRMELRFVTEGIDSNGRLATPAEAAAQNELPSIEAVTLDETLAGLERLDVIKIDVEGAEARAWQGMQAILARHRPVLVFELSPDLLRQTSGVEPGEFLADVQRDYHLFIIPPDGKVGSRPDDIPAILERYAALSVTHLDILARPRR